MWNCAVCLSLLLFQKAATPTPPSQIGEFSGFLWFAVGIVLGIIIGLLVAVAFRKTRTEISKIPSPQVVDGKPAVEKPTRPQTVQYPRRCPTCKSSYTDPDLTFCLNDGTKLESLGGDFPHDPESTLLYPKAR